MTGVRAARREDLRQRVLVAAWDLAERDGLTGWTLRDLGAAVGMRAPSLYTHFDGKDAIHDAMFAQGWQQLEGELAHLDALDPTDTEPRAVLLAGAEAFFDFCTASVPRYQLLFTHVLGDWEPTAAAYEASQRTYRRMVEHLAVVGVTDPEVVDLWTGCISGFVAQQLANDRDGDRWRRLLPHAVDMFLAHATT